MKLAAGAAVVLALSAGLGTYFALEGQSTPAVPRAQQSRTLEEAKADGVISGYRMRAWNGARRDYEVGDGAIHVVYYGNGCGGGFNAGPMCLSKAPLLSIEYQRSAAVQARALLRIAQTRLPNGRINFFEVTRPSASASHIPDARIMLIPKAGA